MLPNSLIIFNAGFYLLQETASDLLVGWRRRMSFPVSMRYCGSS